MLTESTENYLKHIYILQKNNAVTTNDISAALSVAPSSVTKMLKKLQELNLIEYTSHKGVFLTDFGQKTALKTVRKHRLLELFLVRVLGYTWDQVHDEACILEHYISERFEDSIDKLLNYPKYDPHGDPIPNKEGELPFSSAISLSDIEINCNCIVTRIMTEKAEFLAYLQEVGLVPSAQIYVISKNEFGGSINFQIGENKHSIGFDAAKNIFVEIN